MSRSFRPRVVRLAAGLAALALVAACGSGEDPDTTAAAATAPAGGFPVTVESCGHEATFDKAPGRVVLGWGTSIRTLEALGVADRVTGYVSGSNVGLPDGFTAKEVSPDFQPAREAVLAAAPDLFLANDENQVSGEEGTATVADLDGRAYVLGNYCLKNPAPATIDVVYQDVRNLGAIFGVPDKADAVVADLTRRVTAAAARRRSAPQAKVALVQIYDGKVYALSGSYYNAILQGAGMTNVFAGIGENFAEVSAEQVLTSAPDGLFVAYDEPNGDAAAVQAARSAFAATPAVRNGTVFGINNAEISGGGVNIVALIEQTAGQLYGS
ncbi:ABC transporter substrate-binding protein [Cryptosporangium minutisporangium]|uniref:ABC transporter substrate-binding protein n=1 Tax=Cryptosporangium minutisporangium TaxID=113569 RepID=A0ABP6SSV0_9ACTN